jgi:hypothetical protein
LGEETCPFLLAYLLLSWNIRQVMVSSLEKKIDETEKRYEEANKISEERLKQAFEAESKIIQLKTAMQRWLPWSSFFCNIGHRFEYRSNYILNIA